MEKLTVTAKFYSEKDMLIFASFILDELGEPDKAIIDRAHKQFLLFKHMHATGQLVFNRLNEIEDEKKKEEQARAYMLKMKQNELKLKQLQWETENVEIKKAKTRWDNFGKIFR
jgi:hypothetical protein